MYSFWVHSLVIFSGVGRHLGARLSLLDLGVSVSIGH